MSTFKPLFIVAVLGLASFVVYAAISRPPDSAQEPPHIEGLALPATDAPLVQMPDATDLGTPFAIGSTSAQPAESGRNPSYAADGVPESVRGSQRPPAMYPGASPYPSSDANSSPATPDAAGGNAGAAPRGYDSPAPQYPASRYQVEPSRGPSPTDPSDCGSGCPPRQVPVRPDVELADADAPAWPSSRAAPGIAPPFEPSKGEPSAGDPRHGGPIALNRESEPSGNDTRTYLEGEQAFQRMMDQVFRELDGGRLAQAHSALSRFYRKPGLHPEHERQVTELLDQLAGTVVYSRQSLLEPPYVVRPGDTLQSIAQQYEVPPELIANINGIRDPRGVQPGQELKIVRGPFHAVVHLSDYELTLMLGELYAGRFAITVGRDQPNLEGSYIVTGKGVGPTYHGPDGTTFEENNPRNPLGTLWLGLGDRLGQTARVGIHGTNDPRNIGRDAPRGNIGLDRRDIEDVYGILSIGSRVDIRR